MPQCDCHGDGAVHVPKKQLVSRTERTLDDGSTVVEEAWEDVQQDARHKMLRGPREVVCGRGVGCGEAAAWAQAQVIREEPRRSRLGRWLRKS